MTANLGGRRAWLVWGAAILAYAVAVMHRSSFGVSGVEAATRFGTTATTLSGFVVVQLGVYAIMQVPSGLLLDRYGSRLLIAGGALVMAAGQGVLAVTHGLPAAYLARVLIGAGDAATFISVLRLVALWFPVRRVPLLSQLTGILGQLGQVASAIPVAAVLHTRGWTTAFGGLAATGVLAALLTLAAVRDAPGGRVPWHAPSGVLAPVLAAIREPGTRLGFWFHGLAQFSLNVFSLLWGYPFLLAEGLSRAEASGLLTLVVVSSIAAGPVLGLLSGRHPLRRSWLVLSVAGAAAVVWGAVLLQPGPAPRWLLALLCVVLGLGGPASVIGFDVARGFNPPSRMGIATGLVNAGGFLFAMVALLAVGVAIDAQAGTHQAGDVPLDAYRAGFAVLYAFWLLGLLGVVLARRATRRTMADQGVVVPSVREVLARRRGARAVDGLPPEED